MDGLLTKGLIEDDIIDDIFGTSLISGPANSPAIPYIISLVVLPVPIPNYPKPNPCIAPLAANFAAPPKVVADAGPRAPVAKAADAATGLIIFPSYLDLSNNRSLFNGLCK